MEIQTLEVKILSRVTPIQRIKNMTECWEYKLPPSSSGYGQIQHRSKNYKIHRMSAALWLGFDLNCKLLICHKCDNKICINPNHLFVGTHKDNDNDKIKKNRQAKGENQHLAKFKEIDILQIRDLYNCHRFTQNELSIIYNVRPSTIRQIVLRLTWRHI